MGHQGHILSPEVSKWERMVLVGRESGTSHWRPSSIIYDFESRLSRRGTVGPWVLLLTTLKAAVFKDSHSQDVEFKWNRHAVCVWDTVAFGERSLLKCLVRAKISHFGGKKNLLSGWNESCGRSVTILAAASWSTFYNITATNKKSSPCSSEHLWNKQVSLSLHRIR